MVGRRSVVIEGDEAMCEKAVTLRLAPAAEAGAA
jgi:hypothetical protein